ncbi:hypothetical protein FJT64_023590 [Amphibalanus amphitrite]|uniref:RNase H type-1 domain-containing protein n=1 Tax=Amphibalanus amphitrite TaxID=1232801 RepID=A0A6A4WR72_AMPAM|nr:hypothetical protein FJT64_023590 [Amphibalanus amphitrite]
MALEAAGLETAANADGVIRSCCTATPLPILRRILVLGWHPRLVQMGPGRLVCGRGVQRHPFSMDHQETLAARTLCRALALPEDDPLRRVAEADPPTRLRSTIGWRQQGRSALIEAGAEGVTVEPRLEVPLLPWTTCRPIAFNLDVGPGGRRASSNETRREAARQHLAALPAQATWIGMTAPRTLGVGAAAQTSTIGAAIWRTLLDIAERRQVTLQWGPAHCRLAENERADALAKQAATLPQDAVPSDARSLTRAVYRTATRQWRENWPHSFFKSIFGSTLPLPIPGEDREAAISVHQLRARHWGRSLQYLHRIGRHPSVSCLQCPDKRCPAALCAVCREEAACRSTCCSAARPSLAPTCG